ncbi:hypothetical protein X975_25974, partial [Stegodyphus mimosarum]
MNIFGYPFLLILLIKLCNFLQVWCLKMLLYVLHIKKKILVHHSFMFKSVAE